ncbi:NUDIX domain-containing protein [Actinoallomurus rhizosphaericola]|uniref:NUDIX domain-containing protein n=1 Tax=Actinoallomurus rhizosphaericola TaxID=2952536 RepID=UPI00209285CC|nr:NUDIX domain-containing protein [Actinoallomurus rhizosphaericola]MCO5999511.1 NUDIX domain-containing protein [Actinoallomurus rhizosphaericola]
MYFTDVDGNPFALRSARSVEAWQFPGGNVEHGDVTPFDTAIRECQEEICLEFQGIPRLLLTHFLAPRPGWPCAKVGLCGFPVRARPRDLSRYLIPGGW